MRADAASAVTVVVAAIIESAGSFLLTRRLQGTHLAGLWEFPGGKVDAAETHEQALVREIDEELGTAVDVDELVFETTHDYGDRRVALYFYRCRLAGEPRARLGQEMRWVPRAELQALDFPPADAALIDLLSA
jgi:8-oxo-dGTP diphosphatase